MKPQRPTFVAPASAVGRASVAVIRASGPQVREIVRACCRPADLPQARKAALRTIVDSRTGEALDRALVLYFSSPDSFTGEDVLELQVHGGNAIMKAVMESVCAVEGVRLAPPGAFSRRAFENGKMDLTEAEAVADLIDAETAAQRRQALRQLEGGLGRLYVAWADRLLKLLAFVEAEIDFSDEEIPPEISKGRETELAGIIDDMTKHLDDGRRGEKIREGLLVALLGPPNAGKSSLLNVWAQREAAIVAPTPGTTRDLIEIQLDLKGYPVTFVDTAGLRETLDYVEAEGVSRALRRAEVADIKLLVFDGQAVPANEDFAWQLMDEDTLLVINKKDLTPDAAPLRLALAAFSHVYFVSAKTGEGLAALTDALVEALDKKCLDTEQPVLTRLRHRQAIEDALSHLARARQALRAELCAEDLRLAVRAIGRITGHVDVEDVLDVIFTSFCIGK